MSNLNIGQAIKLIRTRRGLSQAEVADLAGKDISYISLIETGQRSPSLSTLRDIAKALSIAIFILIYLTESDSDQIPLDIKEKLMYEAMK